MYLIAVRSKFLGNKITMAEWDLNIVTVCDYAVELQIDLKGYQKWFSNVYHKEGTGDYSKNISPGLSLKRTIIKKVEKELTRELRAAQKLQTEENDDENNNPNPNMKKKLLKKRHSLVDMNLSKVKVADLTFCRDNGQMIRLLEERGEHITAQNFEEMHKTEVEINELIKNNYD